MQKFLALDPGITTGYSLAILDEHILYISCDQEEFSHNNLFDFMYEIDPTHLICESFEYRNNRHYDNIELYPLELIGVVKLFGEPFMQTAAKGKAHYTNEKLQKMGLYVPGKQHGRDAMRHLLQWFTFGYGYQFNLPAAEIQLAQFDTLLDKGDAYEWHSTPSTVRFPSKRILS